VFALRILIFGFAWWLGLYLLARDLTRALLWRAGLGLAAYALAVAAGLLSESAQPIAGALIIRAERLLLLVPAFCWSGALVQLLPEETPLRARLDRAWRFGLLPLAVLGALLTFATDTLVDPSTNPPGVGSGYLALALVALAALLGGLLLVWRTRWPDGPRRIVGLLLAVTLFFGLGIAFLLLPFKLIPPPWDVLGIGVDLLLLDLAIARLDAFDEGETLWPDIVRSFVGAGGAALLFGTQVALAMRLGAGYSLPLLALLLAIIAAAIAAYVFSGLLQAALDKLAFAQSPGLVQARADLRAAAEALPRVDAAIDLAAIEPAEFARLTRRAISHYGDLPRLATSPLTRLPRVEMRLAARQAPDDPIERAAELKRLLAESIARLKPHGADDFGTSDEWRFYNALYFPYVAGLKPYSRRGSFTTPDPIAEAALEWFQQVVPERTLHNWQNAAARLVAEQLRDDRA
jgi:hypothetical protein